MGRMGGLTDTLGALLASLGIELPSWLVPSLALLVLLVLMPVLKKNNQTRRARKLLVRSAHLGSVEREALQDRALALVVDHPQGLLALAEEAERRGLRSFARRALHEVPLTGRLRSERHRLERRMESPPPVSAEAEAAVVERLLEAGMFGAAEARFSRALARWPNAGPLRELHEKFPVSE